MTFIKELSRAMKEDRINLLKYVLAGAIGFGIGGVLWGVFNGTGNFAIVVRSIIRDTFGIALGGILVNMIEGVFLGAIGGILLGLISKNAKKTLQLSFLGAIGFGIGSVLWSSGMFRIIGLLLGYMGLYFVGYLMGIFIGFFIGGAMGGILLSLTYKDRRGILALSSAIGFGIGGILGLLVAMSFFVGVESFIIYGMILGVFGGGSLGVGMYFAEKKHLPTQKEVSE